MAEACTMHIVVRDLAFIRERLLFDAANEYQHKRRLKTLVVARRAVLSPRQIRSWGAGVLPLDPDAPEYDAAELTALLHGVSHIILVHVDPAPALAAQLHLDMPRDLAGICRVTVEAEAPRADGSSSSSEELLLSQRHPRTCGCMTW